MAGYLAAWLTIWSAASATKSPNMISAMGCSPRSARPTLMPTMAASLIGVVKTRSGKRVDSPCVTLKAPP